MALTVTEIKNFRPKEKLYRKLDAHGLMIEVAKSGSKKWIHRYSFNTKSTMRTLGHFPDMTLTEAREALFEDKKLLRQGINPIINSSNPNLPISEYSTFKDVFNEWYKLKEGIWDSEYAKDVKERAVNYLFPDLATRNIGEIKPKDLILTFKKMEKKGVINTLSKVKSIATRVFEHALLLDIIEFNPVSPIRMSVFKQAKKQNYAHLTDKRDYAIVLQKINKSQENTNISKVVYMALNILPHVFLRVAELCELEWKEVDLDERLIRIHPDRMKMRREHLVPMSDFVYENLTEMFKVSGHGKYVFPSPAKGVNKGISSNALLRTLRKIDIDQETMSLHGFRHSASTMLNEMEFPSHLVELQLSHTDRNSSRSTYNKATFLEARRDMMQTWSEYLLRLIRE